MSLSALAGEVRRPSVMVASGSSDSSVLTDWEMPLPPEVQNGAMVLPERSYASQKVRMIIGASPHQIG